MSCFKVIRAAIIAAIIAVASVPTIAIAAPFPDQATWGGTSGGSANAQTLTIANYSSKLTGVPIRFIPGFTNTGSATLTINYQDGSTGAGTIYRITQAGPEALTGGEIVAGQAVTIMWDGSRYLLAPPPPQLIGGFRGLVVQATSNTQVTISATALTVEVNGVGYRIASPSVTCNITSSGANGLDTGAEASSTWYSVWDIYNPATATNACLLSTSITSPTMPAGYVAKLRVGWVRNDASSNFWRTLQFGNRAAIVIGTNPTVMVPIYSSLASTWTAILVGGGPGNVVGPFAPPTASAIDVVVFSYNNDRAYVVPNGSYSTTVTSNPGLIGTVPFGGATNLLGTITLENGYVYYDSAASANQLLDYGWTDNL